MLGNGVSAVTTLVLYTIRKVYINKKNLERINPLYAILSKFNDTYFILADSCRYDFYLNK